MNLTGTILYGINNIYTIETETGIFECRIKGKVLPEEDPSYNPLAPGDIVLVNTDTGFPGKGLILERKKRKNAFYRWNKKRRQIQTLCANVDRIFCIASTAKPPFRPRFIDRVQVQAAIAEIPLTIVINKSDLGLSEMIRERKEYYRRIGIETIITSVNNMKSLEQLESRLEDSLTAFVGQSGVGKTSILNTFFPNFQGKTAEISAKYNRGTHTTNFARMLIHDRGYRVIDTPGIREIEVCGIEPRDLRFYFPEFRDIHEECTYASCTHIHEPGCAVREAVETGTVLPDRYDSYQRIHVSLTQLTKEQEP
ncbi:MAG: ribosome small subunit-dependent GTPase A [Spirochaetia bacterium]